MKGLYLNVRDDEGRIDEIDVDLGLTTHVARAQNGADRVVVSYHPADWPAGPIYASRDAGPRTAAASGWFLFRGRLGDLQGFANAFWQAREVPQRIKLMIEVEGGAFTILLLSPDERVLVTDPFGLHPHYHGDEGPFASLAPSPYFIKEG